jgi:two-component system response regulator HydG
MVDESQQNLMRCKIMANILIVDDSEPMREILSYALTKGNHHCSQAATGEEAIALIRDDIFDITLVDLKMDGINGLDLLRIIREISPDTESIMITGNATIDSAVEAMKLGAYDFVTKPVNREELLITINKALEKQRMVENVKALHMQLKERYKYPDIIGNTPSMSSVFSMIDRISQYDTTVLITGESGTGKELVAKAIHNSSLRRDKPFIPINCAALPENIQASEFFGHVKGSFTDALEVKKGLFEEADGGTVFLDEIGDAAPSTQAKLLRFMENGEVRRVGENTPIYIDVRLIAATNQNLSNAVAEGKFRKDLFYRIDVIKIHIPPLRERKDDIPLLVYHFMQKYNRDTALNAYSISREALSLLTKYDWQGNVRELQNAIQHAIALSRNGTISTSHLPSYIKSYNGKAPVSKENYMSLYELKKSYTLQMLSKNSWDYKKTAEDLGIGKSTIYRKLKEYKVKSSPHQA